MNAYGEAGLLRALSLLDRLDVPLARRESVRRRAIREMLRALAPAGRGAQHAAAEQHAAVLFALPLAGAVELCGAGDEAVAAVEKAARQLGVLCRLREEVLGHGAGNGREGGAVPRAALLAEMARRRRRAVRSAAAADHPGLAAIVEGLGAWFAEPVAHLVARPGPAPPAWDGQGAGVLT
ncbi:MAG: hypothetical protein HY744_02720 [Deltaproteobacteria bacterium]|nr:hypothetical protein [Deltaproteobacteria bacterium]